MIWSVVAVLLVLLIGYVVLRNEGVGASTDDRLTPAPVRQKTDDPS